MEPITVSEDFSFSDLLAHMMVIEAQVRHMERVVITTPEHRYTLYVGIAAIEDVAPKLRVVS